MQTTHATEIARLLRSLPASGTTRDLALQRLTDAYAWGEALDALRAAAERARATSGPLADVLSASAWIDTPEFDSPPERERRTAAIASPAFLALIPGWIRELRQIATTRPGTGACTVASALQVWLWTMEHFQVAGHTSTTAAELADAFWPLLAARCRILELASGPEGEARQFLSDLCHTQAANAAAAAGTACAELVFGYRTHLTWNEEGCATCYRAQQLDELEGLIPGIASAARAHSDVIEEDGCHEPKAGPCAKFDGIEAFTRMRAKLDGCLTGARRAKDRAAAALPTVLMTAPAGVSA